MKMIPFLLLAVVLSCFCDAQEKAPPKDDKTLISAVRDANILGLQLFGLLKEGKENIVFSPYAISASAALPYDGAEGFTESQMARVLRYRVAKPLVADLFADFNGRLMNSPYLFSSSLWVQKGSVKADFKQAIENNSSAALRLVDFITRPDGVRVEMNSWMRERSQGKILDIVPVNDIVNSTRMVVLAGSFLKGRWQQTFDSRSTSQVPFFSDRYVTSTVPTMTATGEYNYLHEEKFSLLEIPYESKKGATASVSLLLFLPHETYGLKGLEEELTIDNLEAWLKNMRKEVVILRLPRFRLAGSFSLVEPFVKLALTNPFRDGANFSGIREIGDLKISKMLHSAVYSVDEWGSEGGISLGSYGDFNPGGRAAIAFNAQHPFLFMVVERGTGAILLMGRVKSL